MLVGWGDSEGVVVVWSPVLDFVAHVYQKPGTSINSFEKSVISICHPIELYITSSG